MSPRSSYDPKFCQELIDCLAKGYSVKGFAGKIGRNKDTIFTWLKQFPDFAEAYGIAQAKSAYFWETGYIEFAQTGKGNAAAFIFALKNRASEEWSDKIVNEIQTTNLDELAPDSLLQLREEINAARTGRIAGRVRPETGSKPH